MGKFEKPSWMILSQNILDGVKSSGTVLKEPSCTICFPNILDTVKSSGTDLKKSYQKQFYLDYTRWCQK